MHATAGSSFVELAQFSPPLPRVYEVAVLFVLLIT